MIKLLVISTLKVCYWTALYFSFERNGKVLKSITVPEIPCCIAVFNYASKKWSQTFQEQTLFQRHD